MSIKIIDENLFNQVAQLANDSPRQRMNYNFHENESDPVNRLLNVMNPETSFPVHRHLNPDKEEFFLVLRGSLITYLYDDQGNIIDKVEVSPKKGIHGMEIPPHVWHSFEVLEPGTVVFEVKQGPYTPLTSENIAPWEPTKSL